MRVASVFIAFAALSDAFVLAPGAQTHVARGALTSEAPTMQIGPVSIKIAAAGTALVGTVVATKKFMPKKEAADVTAFRSSLGSMESLSGLADLKLEREEKEGRKAGVWKEYIKADGRVWFYNTETKIQTWIKPDEFVKLDEVKAAAEAANQARGTSLG